jgi:hypothetical protein
MAGIKETLQDKSQTTRITDGVNEAGITDVGGGVKALNVNVVQSVSGGGSSGGLTDAQLRASPVPVSGTVTASGPLTDAQLRASAVPVSGTFWQSTQPVSGTVAVSNFPSTQAVTGTFWQSTQPVSGPLTDAQLRAAAVPVSGTFWQATQPVSGPLTDGQLRASAVPVSVSTLPALTTGSATIGNVGINVAAASSNSPVGSVSIGSSLGKTNVLKTGTLATSAVTADQVILTYTVTAGKTFYLEYFDVACRLTTFAATATNFGNASIESPAATKLYTQMIAGTGISAPPPGIILSEPIPIAAGTVIRVVCTPSAVTAFTWIANLGGYEK